MDEPILNKKPATKYYAFYTSNETPEECEIYRLIFNNNWDALRSNSKYTYIAEQLETMCENPDEGNLNGQILKVLMVTKKGAEGLDLKNVRSVHVIEPHWQPVLMDQVIGRARRYNSHSGLPELDRNVSVYIYVSTYGTQTHVKNASIMKTDTCKYKNDALGKYGKYITSDEYLYITSEKKKEINDAFQRLIKNSAIDCDINLVDNLKVDDKIKCMQAPSRIDSDKLDTRSAMLYYPDIDDIRSKTFKIDLPGMTTLPYSKYNTYSKRMLEIIVGNQHMWYNPLPNHKGDIPAYAEKSGEGMVVGKIVFKNGAMRIGMR